MSADKYAQFIAEQQRKLSVSGVNPVELTEKKHMSKADIAKLKEPKDKIDADDLEALRNKEHLKKEEVEQVDEVVGLALGTLAGLGLSAAGMKSGVIPKAVDKTASALKKLKKKMSLKKEEVEQIDEVRAIQGKHASVAHKAPSITPSKVKYKGKGTKPKVQSDLNIMASYEIDATEMEQIDEAVKSGRTKELMDFYTKGMAIHKDKMDHHTNMAKMCADCGDDDGWHYHMGRVTDHRFEHEANKGRADRVAGLAAKVKEVADRAEINDKLDKLNRKA